MSKLKQYEALRKSVADARKKMKDAFTEALVEGANALFAKHPALESFGWRQYTDYFNDGDPLRFRVQNEEPRVNGSQSYDSDLGEDVVNDVAGLLTAFDDDDYEAAYGDHVSVTIRRDGKAEVEEYTNHD